VTAGVLVRRALPWGLAYILIWEGFVASAGETAARLAIRSYVRSIVSEQTGVSLSLAEFSLAVGVIVPLAVTVVVLALASHRLARADVA
jgi:ABC-2 type transport system permease protein